MGTIEAGTSLLTLVNVFSCAPEDQDQIVDMIRQEFEQRICQVPGFIAAHLHRSRDGTRVVNYVQWRDAEAYQSMFADSEINAWITHVKDTFRPDVHQYDVVWVSESVTDGPVRI